MAMRRETALAHSQGKVWQGILLMVPTTSKMFTNIYV